LSDVLSNGKKSSNRTGIDTRKVWGRQIHIDLSQGFPLLTTKKMHWKSVVHELLWMISGDTNIQYLLKNGVTFWSEWPYQEYCRPSKNENSTSISAYPPESMGFTQKEFEQTIINNDEFAKKWGNIGKYGYGGLWRKFPARQWQYGLDLSYEEDNIEIDQLSNAINELKTNPDSRRIIVSAWHPYHSNRKEDALLPACHNYVQFGTEELNREERRALLHIRLNLDERPRCAEAPVEQICDNFNIPKYRLNCYYNMRSSDIFLGLPFNCAFYSLLTLIANQLNMIPGEVVYSAADVHLYENHVEQTKVQLNRTIGELPKISIKTKGKSIFDIKYEDIELIGYNPQPAIKAEVAV
jgi:thymidylate synthase